MLVQISETVIVRSIETRKKLQWRALGLLTDSDGVTAWHHLTVPCSADDMHMGLIEQGVPQERINLFLLASNYPKPVLDMLQAPPAKPKKATRRLRQPQNPHMQLSDEWQGKHTHEVFPGRH